MALIKCKLCGAMVSDQAVSCPKCGGPIIHKTNCKECGFELPYNAINCPNCGCPVQPQSYQQPNYFNPPASNNTNSVFNDGPSGKSRGVAALLAFFLGGLGAHYFYLGKPGPAVMNILCVTVGWVLFFIPVAIISILNIIQTIMMLSLTQEEFERRYVYTKNFIPI